MFFLDTKQKFLNTMRRVDDRIRDEWGVLHNIVELKGTTQGTPLLTDKELAEKLQTNQSTVERYRRDA